MLIHFPTICSGDTVSIDGEHYKVHPTSHTTAIITSSNGDEEEVYFDKVNGKIRIIDPYTLRNDPETPDQWVSSLTIYKKR